jgi:hypothetical protein
MSTNIFKVLHLASLFKYEKKNLDFFDRVKWTHLTMVPKTTLKGTFETQKNIFFLINQSVSRC